MRKREEIEVESGPHQKGNVVYLEGNLQSLILEVLLDIRDLLNKKETNMPNDIEGFEPEADPEIELPADEIQAREMAGEPPFDEEIELNLNINE